MKDETSQIEQRVQRYWYSDGIAELMGGGVFLILSLYFTAQQYFGEESLAGNLLHAAFVLVLIGALLLGRKLINSLKTRVTYPRTGYVEYRRYGDSLMWRRFLAFFAAMGVAMAAVFITRRIESIDAMAASTGALVAAIFLVKQGWSSGVARFYVFSLVSLALGVALSLSGFLPGYNLGLFYGVMGVILAISGGITLKRYLSENPMPAEVGNE